MDLLLLLLIPLLAGLLLPLLPAGSPWVRRGALAAALLQLLDGLWLWQHPPAAISAGWLPQLGGLWSRRPLVGIAFLAGAAGLMGLPPFGGFAALRELLELAAHSQLPLGAVSAAPARQSVFSPTALCRALPSWQQCWPSAGCSPVA